MSTTRPEWSGLRSTGWGLRLPELHAAKCQALVYAAELLCDAADWRKLADTGDFDSNYLRLHAEEPALQ